MSSGVADLTDALAALPTSKPLGRLADFKPKPSSHDDEERRARWLADQKARRHDQFNLARRLAMGATEEPGEEAGIEEPEEMDTASGSPAASELRPASKRKVHKNLYADQLMLSEWMRAVPADIVENWLFTVCPVGKRCLVVSSRGTTAAYRRNGSSLTRFPSSLPGGARHRRGTSQDYALLDCVFDEVEGVFFVLDMLCWRGVPVIDSDVDFRTYWTMTKFQEDYGEPERSAMNPFRFVPLPRVPCTPHNLMQAAATAYPYPVDGFLFFHREGHYVTGVSPLVTWLKPEMLPDMFGVSMPTCVLQGPWAPPRRLPPFSAPVAPSSFQRPVAAADCEHEDGGAMQA